MAQLSDDCFAFGGPLMSVEAARTLLAERVGPVAGIESAGLAEALGRVLAEDVAAPIDVPPYDNSAVDGYAVRFADLSPDSETVLPVIARVAAGSVPGALDPAGKAVRIFTGAPMPEGCDTVLMQEDCRAADGAVVLRPGIKRGANRRKAGEDIQAGSTILLAGRRLKPQDIGLLASVGHTQVAVRRPLRVAVFSTGDEVTEPGRPLEPGHIYDANRFTLTALLRKLGAAVTDFGILRDRPAELRAALAQAAEAHDLIVTSGGVSTGEEDHVKAAVEALGSLYAWRMAIKPGRPVALGQVGAVPFIGLPGNPVAAMITFFCLGRPLIERLSGARVSELMAFRVRADFDYKKKEGRREYVRVRLEARADGLPSAVKFERDGAGILSSMVACDGLVQLHEDITRIEPGAAVDYLPFSELC
jgi:molybdopterin molybdotransferase